MSLKAKLSAQASLSANPPPKPKAASKGPQKKAPSAKASRSIASFVVKGLQTIQARQKKDRDESVVSTMEDELVSDVKLWIPSRFPDIDRIFGGGWPVGRVSEVFGPEAAGKSALTHQAVRGCQEIGGLPIYVDWENALERNKMAQLGIDPKNIVYIKAENIEAAWKLVWDAIDMVRKMEVPPTCILLVWDSIAATISKAEVAGQYANFDVAKIMSQACRKAYLIAPKVNAHFLFVNQERVSVGVKSSFGGPPKHTPGGDAVKYACSLRVRCSAIERLKEGTAITGLKIRVWTKKNKCAPPFRMSEYILDFEDGPSPEWTMFHDLLAARAIKTASKPKGPVKKTVKESPLDDDETGVPKKGPTRYQAAWTEASFEKSEWMALMADPAFRTGATAAYKVIVDGRRAQRAEIPADAEDASKESD